MQSFAELERERRKRGSSVHSRLDMQNIATVQLAYMLGLHIDWYARRQVQAYGKDIWRATRDVCRIEWVKDPRVAEPE